jgi:hypothetical protein
MQARYGQERGLNQRVQRSVREGTSKYVAALFCRQADPNVVLPDRVSALTVFSIQHQPVAAPMAARSPGARSRDASAKRRHQSPAPTWRLRRYRSDVAAVTLYGVTDSSGGVRWLLAAIQVPASPSRYRVAIWRELRKIGAVPLGGGVWAAPAAPVFATGFDRVVELVAKAEGQVLSFDGRPRDGVSEGSLLEMFNAARAEEWAEFASECDKFEAEIAKERRIGKLTVAELDEEEQSLDRLRRWARELKARDIFTVAEGVHAEERLKRCQEVLDGYATEVYQAVHAPLGTDSV